MGVLGTLSRMLHTAGASSLLTFVAALHFLSGTRGAQSPVRGGFKAVLRFDTQSSNQNALSIVGIHTHALQHCDSNGRGFSNGIWHMADPRTLTVHIAAGIHFVRLHIGQNLVQHQDCADQQAAQQALPRRHYGIFGCFTGRIRDMLTIDSIRIGKGFSVISIHSSLCW